MSEATKFCPGCQVRKLHGDFHRHRNRSDGLQPYCKACLNSLRRSQHAQNPKQRRGWVLMGRYGITMADWEALFESQGHKCAICGTSKKGHHWHTDHDHATGRVRGILCSGCNLGLGVLEKPGWRKAADAYLHR